MPERIESATFQPVHDALQLCLGGEEFSQLPPDYGEVYGDDDPRLVTGSERQRVGYDAGAKCMVAVFEFHGLYRDNAHDTTLHPCHRLLVMWDDDTEIEVDLRHDDFLFDDEKYRASHDEATSMRARVIRALGALTEI
jgi:hypothetical protein